MKKPRSQSGSPLMEDGFFLTLAHLVSQREPLVLVTVAAASGSAPGRAGAKMIVTGETLYGTVGGGKVEKEALTQARSRLSSIRGPEIINYDVVQDLGMSCGGSMSLLFEPIIPPPRLVVFGAGHVSQALCAQASLVGFDVTVCDDRKDWLTEERFPGARSRIPAALEEALDQVRIDSDTLVASLTSGHALDEQVVLGIATRGFRPRYLGVIGSRRKAEILRCDLVEKGVSKEIADTVRIPMGINIGAADPREIALSIVAEMVAELRGVDSPEW